MYESPITQILGEMQTQYENDCMKVVQQCGFDVNKEELIKALQYDRNQYSKGYDDGYNKAIDDYVERLKETYKPCKEADNYMYTNVCRRFDDIAQQLKEGDTDGNSTTDN